MWMAFLPSPVVNAVSLSTISMQTWRTLTLFRTCTKFVTVTFLAAGVPDGSLIVTTPSAVSGPVSAVRMLMAFSRLLTVILLASGVPAGSITIRTRSPSAGAVSAVKSWSSESAIGQPFGNRDGIVPEWNHHGWGLDRCSGGVLENEPVFGIDRNC